MFGDEGKPLVFETCMRKADEPQLTSLSMATSVLVGDLVPGAELKVSSWELEIDSEITAKA